MRHSALMDRPVKGSLTRYGCPDNKGSCTASVNNGGQFGRELPLESNSRLFNFDVRFWMTSS